MVTLTQYYYSFGVEHIPKKNLKTHSKQKYNENIYKKHQHLIC